MSAEPITYAVGDVHGCADLLVALLDKVDAHAAGRARRLVFIGDYIDRGPDSARVIETLRKLQWREPDTVCLMGNHEQMLLNALRVPGGLAHWLYNGGVEMLESYGVAGPEDLPSDVLDWVEALPSLHSDALRWYVHAGFEPGVAPPESTLETRLWVREPFLSQEHDFGRHVVHGHTPSRDGRPETRRFRTNLDTGAVYGGALTAGVFTADRPDAVEFLQIPAR